MMTSGRSIGGALLRLDQPDSAIAWLERSAELEREFEAKDILAPTLNSLARAYRETGRPGGGGEDPARSIVDRP
ncbi:MAG: tetratricopeptide repeat protein [Flavobacteriales bacterium]|nr:tetratricopeptide repeat protein [Flavobacteriales bacterium]